MATIDEKKLAEIKETYKQQFGIDPDVIDGMAQVCLYMTNEWEKVLEKEQKRYEQINKEYRERKQKALRQFDLFEKLRIPPAYRTLFTEPNKKVEIIRIKSRPRKIVHINDDYEDDKIIDHHKNFQHKPNGGFIKGK